MNKALPLYEVYAMRYATHDRQRHENFISSDLHDGPMPLDYFVWVILGNDKTYLVGTGFNAETASTRKRTFLRCPIRSWANVGVTTTQLSGVIMTHLHFDHAGNLNLLPTAPIHLQERELQYVTGRYMQYKLLRKTFAVEDVVNVVRSLYDNRVHFHLGDDELTAGIRHMRSLPCIRRLLRNWTWESTLPSN